MNRKILLNLLGLIFCLSVFSQNKNDSIQATKIFGGYKYENKGKTLTYSEILEMMKENPEAYQYMNKAKNERSIASVLVFAGGLMIGWSIETSVRGIKPNWTLAGVGCGFLIVSIPIISSSNKNAMIALEKYNTIGKGLSQHKQYDLKLGFNPNGLGLVLNF